MLTFTRSDKLEYLVAYFACCLDTMNSNSSHGIQVGGWSDIVKKCYTNTCHYNHYHAEFVACFEAAGHGSWLRNFILGFSTVYSILETIKIFWARFAKNDKSSGSLKYLEVKYLVFKEKVRDFQVSIIEIFMDCRIVDPMTKVLKPKAFRRHVTVVGLEGMP